MDADLQRERYDELPYPKLVAVWTHPASLGAMATLFGHPAAPAERCRLLDIGCGVGTNVISMAAELPDAHFVGVDISPRQISEGRALVDELGLGNISLLAGGVGELADELEGPFDYIVCHGVYSWVSEAIQGEILRAVRRLLAPDGVAYISYNALPGWHLATLVRELFLRGTDPAPPPLERVRAAHTLLDEEIEAAEAQSLRHALLHFERRFLEGMDDAYIWHEYFSPEHHPLYFSDFVARARAEGLDYLTNARPERLVASSFPPNIAAALAGIDERVGFQQAVDHHTNARFRATLLCHAGRPEPTLTLAPAGLARLHLSLPRDRDLHLEGASATVINRRGLPVGLSTPRLVELVRRLYRAAPATLPLAELVDLAEPSARPLVGALIGLVLADVLELRAAPIVAASTLAERPLVPIINRAQARRAEPITSRVFVSQRLDELGFAVVPLLDGAHTLAEIAAKTGRDLEDIEHLARVLLDRAVLVPAA